MMKKIGAGIAGLAIVAAAGLGGMAIADDSTTVDALNVKVSELVNANTDLKADVKSLTPVEVPTDVVTLDTLNSDVDEIKAKLLEEDAVEAEAEVQVLDDIERRDYKELFEFLELTYANIVEREDINKVVVRDVNTVVTDLSDRESTVEYELKVYYEDADGNDVKKYVTATANIEDDEVEDLTFEETA